MRHLSADLNRQLIGALMQLPNVDEIDTRRGLIRDWPFLLQRQVDLNGDSLKVLNALLIAAQNWGPVTEVDPLIILIDEAAYRVGSDRPGASLLAEEFSKLQEKVNAEINLPPSSEPEPTTILEQPSTSGRLLSSAEFSNDPIILLAEWKIIHKHVQALFLEVHSIELLFFSRNRLTSRNVSVFVDFWTRMFDPRAEAFVRSCNELRLGRHSDVDMLHRALRRAPTVLDYIQSYRAGNRGSLNDLQKSIDSLRGLLIDVLRAADDAIVRLVDEIRSVE